MKKDDVKWANGAASLNGTTTKTAATATATAANSQTEKAEPKPEPKAEPSKPTVEVKEARPSRTLPDIFKQQDKVAALRDKWETLDDTSKKLDSFKLGSESLRDELRIRDGKGTDFSTSNSNIIAKVLELLKVEVAAKVEEVENEIKAAA